jgi:ABC-type transport system substrate-binding protein
VIPEGTTYFVGSWRDGCIGTGPYRVVSFDPGKRVEMEPNPFYWRQGYPKNDGLVFTLGLSPQEILDGFRSGRFSMASQLNPTDVEKLRHDPEFAPGYREIPSLSTYFLVFNIHHGPFADEKLRREFIQSIDAEGLVRRNLGRLAVPAHSLIPPGLLGYEPAQRVSSATFQKAQSRQDVEFNCGIHAIFDGARAPL